MVAAGDLIGGSTFISGLFQDEPTVEALDALGLDISGVGNPEFDEGRTSCRGGSTAAATPRRGASSRVPPLDTGAVKRFCGALNRSTLECPA
jgi:hypothetical protein